MLRHPLLDLRWKIGDMPSLLAAAPTVTDWLSGGGSVVTAIIALVALIIALRQLGEARSARQLTGDLDKARSQPYVVIFMEPSAATPMVIDLVIRNFGQTAATNVRLTVAPALQRAESHDPATSGPESVALPDVIPCLAPGQEWRTLWDYGPQRYESNLPQRHVAEVSYSGIDDTSLHSKSVLDWAMYVDRRWVEVRGVHDVAQSLKQIEKSVANMTEPFGRKGISVWTRDGHTKDADFERERQRRFPHDAPPRRRSRAKRR